MEMLNLFVQGLTHYLFPKVSRTDRRALELISTAGCSVSLVALTCTILVTSIFWKKLTSVRTKVLLNLCVALAASCVLVIIAGAVQEHEVCADVINLVPRVPQASSLGGFYLPLTKKPEDSAYEIEN